MVIVLGGLFTSGTGDEVLLGVGGVHVVDLEGGNTLLTETVFALESVLTLELEVFILAETAATGLLGGAE